MSIKYFFLITLILLVISCQKDNEIIIKDISIPKSDTIIVDKNKNYFLYTIEVKGEVDDTIVIDEKIKLCCEIDTIFRFDYYGGDNEIILNYKPYKASKGFLKIKHELH